MMLEIALGPLLWIVFAASAGATILAIVVAVRKRGFGWALAAVPLPFFVSSAGAALELFYLERAVAEEGNGFAVVAPALARALMLAMLGFAATLAPAIPAAMGAKKDEGSRWSLIPLLMIPVFAAAQLPFGYPAASLIRLVAYFGVAGVVAKRNASFAVMIPVVAAGESAAVAVAHVHLFSSLALAGVIEVVTATSREIAVARWFGVASFLAVVVAQMIARRWLSLLLAPLCLAFAWLGDATDRITTLVR